MGSHPFFIAGLLGLCGSFSARFSKADAQSGETGQACFSRQQFGGRCLPLFGSGARDIGFVWNLEFL